LTLFFRLKFNGITGDYRLMPRIRSYCGGFTQTNGYLIESAAGAKIVVDAPDGMAEWLEEEGIAPDVLLLTHAHFDHVIDAARIRDRFSCPIQAFTAPDLDLTLETVYQDLGVRVESYLVDETIFGGSRIVVGDLVFDCFHVPGHSPDSLCFFLPTTDPQERPHLFGGDVLFHGSVGRTDFPHGDHAALIRGIREQLFALSDDTIVYPGHGPVTNIGVEKATNPVAGVRA